VPIFYYNNFNLACKYTRRRRYVIKPPRKDRNSFRNLYQVLKMHVEMRTCRIFCSCNDLFHVFTSALTELSRKLFKVQRPELAKPSVQLMYTECLLYRPTRTSHSPIRSIQNGNSLRVGSNNL